MDWAKSPHSAANGDCVEWRKSSHSAMNGSCVEWRKSSHCTFDGHCVEVAGCQVRDSKDPAGPVLSVTPQAWRAFLGAVKSGEFPQS